MKVEVKEIIEKNPCLQYKGAAFKNWNFEGWANCHESYKRFSTIYQIKILFFHRIEKLNFDQEMVGLASVEVAWAIKDEKVHKMWRHDNHSV